MTIVNKKNPIGPIGQHVARRVAEIRAEQRLTYKELSERIAAAGRHIPVLALSRIESLERRVDADDLAAIAAALGFSTASLMGLVNEQCSTCQGSPPAGFTCNECGSGQVHSEPAEGPVSGLLPMEQLNAIAQALAKRKRS